MAWQINFLKRKLHMKNAVVSHSEVQKLLTFCDSNKKCKRKHNKWILVSLNIFGWSSSNLNIVTPKSYVSWEKKQLPQLFPPAAIYMCKHTSVLHVDLKSSCADLFCLWNRSSKRNWVLSHQSIHASRVCFFSWTHSTKSTHTILSGHSLWGKRGVGNPAEQHRHAESTIDFRGGG